MVGADPTCFFFFFSLLAGFHIGSLFSVFCIGFHYSILAFMAAHALARHFSSALAPKVVVVFHFPYRAAFLPLFPGRLSSGNTPFGRVLCSLF
jgi:hypothetical protein